MTYRLKKKQIPLSPLKLQPLSKATMLPLMQTKQQAGVTLEFDPLTSNRLIQKTFWKTASQVRLNRNLKEEVNYVVLGGGCFLQYSEHETFSFSNVLTYEMPGTV